MINTQPNITAHLVPDADRTALVGRLFGLHFPIKLEPTIFDTASMLASDYRGGY